MDRSKFTREKQGRDSYKPKIIIKNEDDESEYSEGVAEQQEKKIAKPIWMLPDD